MVEKVPYSVMFLRSFIVDLMDQMEKVIPSFTPELLMDEQPQMAFLPDAGARLEQSVAAATTVASEVTIVSSEVNRPSAFSRLLVFVKCMFSNHEIKDPVATRTVLSAAGH